MSTIASKILGCWAPWRRFLSSCLEAGSHCLSSFSPSSTSAICSFGPDHSCAPQLSPSAIAAEVELSRVLFSLSEPAQPASPTTKITSQQNTSQAFTWLSIPNTVSGVMYRTDTSQANPVTVENSLSMYLEERCHAFSWIVIPSISLVCVCTHGF